MRANKKYQLQHVVSGDPKREAIGNIKFTGSQFFDTLLTLLPASEDFDGLVTHLEDHQNLLGNEL